jgi:hypothetical protein
MRVNVAKSRLTPLLMLLALVAGTGCSRRGPATHDALRLPNPVDEIRNSWGVEIVGVRRSAANSILDFRYRIVDPEKALPLVDRRIDPMLIDQATGLEIEVPSTPKIGPMRQTTKYGPPKKDRTYFIFFTNPGRRIQAGDEITVEIGEFRVENLVVE